MKQLALSLNFETDYSKKKLYIGDFNKAAVDWLNYWPNASCNQILFSWIYGPKACGKTHLINIWGQRFQAYAINSQSIHNAPRDLVGKFRFFILDNASLLLHEEWFLHFLNILIENKAYLLIVDIYQPKNHDIFLPDLKSRLSLFHVVEIALPEDMAIELIFRKMLFDHAIIIPKRYIRFILKNIERSFEAIQKWVDILDCLLSKNKKINFEDIAEKF